MDYTQELTTPIEKKKVVIKTLLTGGECERVDTAQAKYMSTEDGEKFTVTDMAAVMNAQKHELLAVSVISIDGDSTDILKRLLKSYDYEWVYNEVVSTQKKMKVQTSPTPS